jgi:hypothetical protein
MWRTHTRDWFCSGTIASIPINHILLKNYSVQVETVLAKMANANMPPFHTLTPGEARKLYNN